MTWLLGYVDPSDPRFVAAVLAITFNPLFWNVVSVLTLTLSQRLHRQTNHSSFPFVCLWPVWNHLCFPSDVGTQLGDADQGSPSPWGSHDVLASTDGPRLLPGWAGAAGLCCDRPAHLCLAISLSLLVGEVDCFTLGLSSFFAIHTMKPLSYESPPPHMLHKHFPK